MRLFPLRFTPKNSAFYILAVLFLVLFNSCVSTKEILYLQDIETLQNQTDAVWHEPTIRPADHLTITVSSYDMEASAPFNLKMPGTAMQETSGTSNSQNSQLQRYQVNNDGTIEFPVLGTIQVGGLTKQELVNDLKQKLTVYIKDPIVQVSISNYKITVLGEVLRPGNFPVTEERVTLLEALGKAGDMTIFGKRENVLVLRENDGVKTYAQIDLTKSEFLNSPYYFLQQNDVVYVQPNNAQVKSAAYNRNTSVYISIASVLISLLLVLSR